MTDGEALKAKIENLTPEQTDEAYQIMSGKRVAFYRVLCELAPDGEYITDTDIKGAMINLMHEDYVLDAIKQVTEGN